MKALRTYPMIVLLAFSLMSACSNPSEKPVKGNHYKDEEDTTKKDSIQEPKRVNPEDSVRRY